jgi:hypothetical protein
MAKALICGAGRVWLQGKGGGLKPGQALVLLPPKEEESGNAPAGYLAPLRQALIDKNARPLKRNNFFFDCARDGKEKTAEHQRGISAPRCCGTSLYQAANFAVSVVIGGQRASQRARWLRSSRAQTAYPSGAASSASAAYSSHLPAAPS